MMTWEEIIIQIRTQPEFAELVEKAYFDENLTLNVERFKSSREYSETKKIIEKYCSLSPKTILDIGPGNGISAVSFALDGYDVAAVEPDKSETVGSGAIRKLKEHYRLSNLSVYESFGENLPFGNDCFDFVYIRQAMHHASNLKKFVSEAARVLKSGGLFLTARDHVIYDEKDKRLFLETHPLQKYYGGENAFTFEEYEFAIKSAGLDIKKVLRHFDSVINYYPMKEKNVMELKANGVGVINDFVRGKLYSWFANNSFARKYFSDYVESKSGHALDERAIPGRMYSFVALKNS